jgi:predicted Ser/Thr protein kinase
MVQCPKCSARNLPDSRFCSSCAQPLSAPSQMPTADAFQAGPIISSNSVPTGGFTPGTILAGRYRIIGLLGRGGMGEVYRADDLKLGQPVALKFLPPQFAEDSVRRERFFAEVRITRQLAHPNICRVYDIAEIDGRHFLSMEYIDGEDLASLIKRIGHLTSEKALDIARQLAAGLAAAHERGVLHRDLKPANIMLDGHGRVRITDFGLAIAAEDETQAAEIAGTPAYMAPEQLAGKGATVRSDIYSLGLVLYEIYTGKKAFTATNLAELREQKETHTPRAPSEIRQGIDPVVERLIQRSMERDPNARPSSVAQLALALPGGDPLAAALAAGETPSPEMVAASGGREGLRPAIAWALLACIVIGILVILPMQGRRLERGITYKKSPEALVERSRSFLQKAGLDGQFQDSAYGFATNIDLRNHIENSDKAAIRRGKIDARIILFWYRQSPRPLGISGLASDSTSPDNPPLRYPGEVLIILDSEERLVSMRRVPPEQSRAEAVPPPDWMPFFAEAGLEYSQWTQADAQKTPPSYADSRAAWQGFLPDRPGAPARIEAASLQGKPISFEVIDPRAPALQLGSVQQRPRIDAQAAFILFVVVTALVAGIFFARRNLRLGRGDRRSAKRLAIFVLGAGALSWAMRLPQVSLPNLLYQSFIAVPVWILYVAIEPYVRRKWPQVLVSWTRLLSGEWQDPLVARDTLVGMACGIIAACVGQYAVFLPSPLLFRIHRLPIFELENLLGTRFVIGSILDSLLESVSGGLFVVCFFIFLCTVFRSQKAAIAILAVTSMVVGGIETGIVIGVVQNALLFFAFVRFGFVAASFFMFTIIVINTSPITYQSSAWYAPYGYLVLAIFAVLVIYAFRFSIGKRPLLAPSRLDD